MKHRIQACVAAAAVALLSGCSDGGAGGATASQVAARVSGQEITVHQLNAALARVGNIAPEQIREATSAVLERLIDQELMRIQAEAQKLDRDPSVMQAIDAARREIVARAYLERVMGQAAKADRAEIIKFYNDNPELFARRRVYALQEFSITAPPERHGAIRAVIERNASSDALTAWLKRENIPFTTNGGVKSAEDLPREALKQIAALRDGQTGVLTTPTGLLVVHVAGSREQPLDEAAAAPLIERYLANRVRTERAQAEVSALREQATIEYVGEFSAPQKLAAATAAAEPGAAAPATAAASAPVAPSAPSDSALSPAALQKGVGGLK